MVVHGKGLCPLPLLDMLFECQLSNDNVPLKMPQCLSQREQELRHRQREDGRAGCRRAGRFPAWAEEQAVCRLKEHLATAGQ